MRDQLMLPSHSDTVDVADVVRTLKGQWRAVFSFLALGVLGAVAVILFAPKRYEGKASVLARTSSAGGASVLGRMAAGGIDELMSGVGGGGGGTSLETELQMLRSRALAGQVVDSLKLQIRVREPAGVPAAHLIQSYDLARSFEPRRYVFERAENGTYRVSGAEDGKARSATPGQPVSLDIGTVTLAATALPAAFRVLVYDREDAIARVSRRLTATKAGGEVAKVTYRGDDRETAAAVPNSLIAFYLERRKTVDRGTNQRRVEYVTEQVQQTSAELAAAERDLRRYQEQTLVFDAELFDVAQLEATAKLRESLIQLQVDEEAINQLLAQADKGTLRSRDLAAYPVFMKGSAVSPLITQLSELEIQKARLLERRTERDPEVIALDNSMKTINGTIVGMARSYASSIAKQRSEFRSRLDASEKTLAALPAANERVGRLQRDVLRLTQLYTALQAQLVEARLAAIGEGGEVRQVDLAAVPRKAAFPQPFLTMGIGTAGGLVAGMVAALFLGWFGRWLRDPVAIERLTGITAQRYQSDTPLLVTGSNAPRTVLVIPLDDRAQSRGVAERLARTASARSLPVSVLDFSGNGNGTHPVGADNDIVRQIDQLEQQQGVLVVQLPALSSDTTVAALRETRPVVLVASPGPVDRARLTAALDTLRRMEIPVAGIVISEATERGRLRTLL
jgi:uncharacterized protein involved in exopolysaccharide biosynthesis